MDNTELLARYILSRVLWWKHDLEGLEKEAIAELVKQINIASLDIGQRIDDEIGAMTDVSEWNYGQLMAVNAWADDVLAGSKDTLADTILLVSVGIGVASIAAANRMLTFDGEAKAVRPLELPRETVTGWFENTELGAGGVRSMVNTAFDDGVKLSVIRALQESEAGTSSDALRDKLHAALDDGVATTRRELETVFETCAQTGEATAYNSLYDQNKQIIQGYRRVEVLDSRTCILCALYDGEYFDVNERLPFYSMPHPRCRGSWVPVLKGWDALGFDSESAYQKKAREWALRDPDPLGANGAKLNNFGTTTENYGGWWASLTPEQKALTSIGKVRTKLLEEGKIQWHDMLDRRLGRVKTLQEMGFDKNAKPLR